MPPFVRLLTFAALLPLLAASASFAVPLPLPNPGFEDGLKGWNEAERDAPMSRPDPMSARTGALGLRVEDNDALLGSSLESAPLPASPGRTYRLGFFARSSVPNIGCGVYLRFRDAGRKLLPDPPAATIPGDAAEWTPCRLEIVAPADAASVSVWIHSFSKNTGAWDIDDLVLSEGDAAAVPVPAKSGPDFSKLPPLPANPPAVVLKLDDLATGGGNVPRNWKRLTDFALERKVKVSIGIITQSLETANPSYINYIKDLQKTGLVEFWFHGYDHREWQEGGRKLQEFKGTPYEHQKDHFVKSQALAKDKLGFVFTTFGSPFNGFDEATNRVLAEDSDMKVFLFGNPADKSSGKIILERVGGVNIEDPLFVPNAGKFIAGYLKNTKGRSFYVIQGHPNQWDDARWAEFVRLVDYLQQNKIPIVTPMEAAALVTQ